MKAAMDNLPQILKTPWNTHERSNRTNKCISQQNCISHWYILKIVQTVNLNEITYVFVAQWESSELSEIAPPTHSSDWLWFAIDFVTSCLSVSEIAPYTLKSSLFVVVSKTKVYIIELTHSIPQCTAITTTNVHSTARKHVRVEPNELSDQIRTLFSFTPESGLY